MKKHNLYLLAAFDLNLILVRENGYVEAIRGPLSAQNYQYFWMT